MRHLDLVELVALAADVSEVEVPKLVDLLDTAEVAALLADARPPRLAHEAAAAVLVGIVAIGPLPAGNRRLALLGALQLLALNGLVAALDPTGTRELLAGVEAGTHDATSVASWLDGRVTARDPIDGAIRELLSSDALRAIELALSRARRHRRRLAVPEDLVMGLFWEGTGPAGLALGAQGPGREVLRVPPRPFTLPRLSAFDPDVRKALELALRSSTSLGHAELNGGHLLLGLLGAGHDASLPGEVDPAEVRRLVVEILGPASSDDGEIPARLGRLAARLRTSDPDAAAELDAVADHHELGLDRLVAIIRAWRGEVFLDALSRDDTVVRLLGDRRLGAASADSLHETLVAKYVADLQRYPALSRAEEAQLAALIRNEPGDAAADAQRRLIQSNLRLVIPVARKYLVSGMSLLELIQEGNIGLLQAAERFDPAKGFRFATFATWWIRTPSSKPLPASPASAASASDPLLLILVSISSHHRRWLPILRRNRRPWAEDFRYYEGGFAVEPGLAGPPGLTRCVRQLRQDAGTPGRSPQPRRGRAYRSRVRKSVDSWLSRADVDGEPLCQGPSPGRGLGRA